MGCKGGSTSKHHKSHQWKEQCPHFGLRLRWLLAVVASRAHFHFTLMPRTHYQRNSTQAHHFTCQWTGRRCMGLMAGGAHGSRSEDERVWRDTARTRRLLSWWRRAGAVTGATFVSARSNPLMT